MKTLCFMAITLLIAYCRLQLPPGNPDLLLVWLVALAFYTENKQGVFQAFWIGILHSFPGMNPWSPLICILAFKFLQHQRFHLGRDHFLPRFISIVCLVAVFDFLEWSQLRPPIEESLQLIGTHAALTAIVGLPLLSFGQKMENYLGFRQTRYDF
jgi:hypothetical protein